MFDSWVQKIRWRRDRLPTPVFLGFPCGSTDKQSATVWETWVQSLGWEDPLEKGKVTHLSIMAWRIPWAVWCLGSQSLTQLSDFHFHSGPPAPPCWNCSLSETGTITVAVPSAPLGGWCTPGTLSPSCLQTQVVPHSVYRKSSTLSPATDQDRTEMLEGTGFCCLVLKIQTEVDKPRACYTE